MADPEAAREGHARVEKEAERFIAAIRAALIEQFGADPDSLGRLGFDV